jgi:ABC-type glycerol-3-phosphate transport system substrate-binding protein
MIQAGTTGTSRRALLRGVAVLVASGTVIAGCGPRPPRQETARARELNLVWSGWILDQNPVIYELAEEYTKQTGIKITLSSAPQDLQQKLLLEAQQRKSTWGGWEGHTAFVNTAALVERDVIAPWDSYVSDEDRRDFLPTSWEEQKYKGKVYSIPYRVSPLVMIYRPSLLQQLGFTEFPTTWEGIFELCEKAVKDLSQPGKRMNGIVFITTAWYCHWTVMATLTPKPFDTGQGIADLDQPAAVEAFKIIKRLYSYSTPDILATDISNITQAGLSVIHFQHILMAQRMRDALKGDLKIARLPRTPQAQGTTFWSSGPNILKYYGAEAEVAKFWLWLSKQKRMYDSLWLKNGSPPNRRSLWKQFEQHKGKELDPGYWDVDDMQAKSQAIPNSLWITLQATITKRVTDEFLQGKITSPEEAVAIIKRDTREEIAKQSK